MKISKAHCLFEQSGTFKNEFIRLGIPAIDYDIKNDFGETDRQIDLFSEIENAYGGGKSIFDEIAKEDLIIAFFPCVRFEDQIVMAFQGTWYQEKNYSDKQKLECDLRLHKELHELYSLITKMATVALDRGLRMLIENPKGGMHYLTRYWALKPKLIDNDRTDRGDYYQKPTQYWFLNCEPEQNLIMEPLIYREKKTIEHQKKEGDINRTVLRSMIAPEYANRFIREFILDG